MVGLRDSFPVVFVSFLSIFFCSSIFAEIHPAANSTANIFILAYNTEFKRNLTAALVQDFNAKGISVTVDSVSNRSKYSAADYDAVTSASISKNDKEFEEEKNKIIEKVMEVLSK